ncbi:MAG TPA: ABC transporter substrate-binding protein [Solirubrobacteraceae bacterium]|nr:ABC transporter substrate-binding protein [Solirubrobacteraceae bacterium]
MQRRLMALATVLASAIALAACGGSGGSSASSSTSSGASSSSSAQAAGTPQRGGNLVFARTADILTLDPANMTDNESIWTVENVYEPLFAATPDGKHLQPWLATGYKLSSNHLVWTIYLRHGVRFQNGKPMTSADVKFSIQRVSAKATNPFAFIDAAIKSIQTPNPYTVVITTRYPWAPLLSDLALFANSVIPDNYGGESESQFFQHPIGTGPFMVQSWQKGRQIVLVRNPYYWQAGKPYLNQVTFVDVPNDNTRELELESGQAQIDEFPPFSSISALKANPNVRVALFPSSRVDFLEMNEDHAPFQNVYVRRAIEMALNRSAMVKAVLFGYGTVAGSFLSPALWAHDPSITMPPYSLAAAKAQLAKSPVPHGFSTTLLVGSGVSNEQSLGQIIQADLAPIGIHVTLKPVDPNSEYTDIQNGQYDMAFNYNTTDIIDPDEMVSFGAMGGNTGQKTHALFTNYNNVAVDNWAQQAERTFNQAQRQALYDKIQQQIAYDEPLIALYYSPFVYAYSPKVHGFDVYPTGNYHLENVWLSH